MWLRNIAILGLWEVRDSILFPMGVLAIEPLPFFIQVIHTNQYFNIAKLEALGVFKHHI